MLIATIGELFSYHAGEIFIGIMAVTIFFVSAFCGHMDQ